ncbi:DNA polymerase III subunit delta [Candidatus Pelagibacter sp.]|nr:DNA polymerase III subunit delta [Candidatus Pelagibacter sp.]
MILKSYETKKINLNKNKFLLFYGKNDGLKNETIEDLIKNKTSISYYEEKEILENSKIFLESIISKSLFENEKIVIVKRASEKFFKVIEEISSKNIEDLIIIVNADNLDKKSKLRSFYEKSKEYVCVAFYPDNDQTLLKLAYNYLADKKVSVSPSNVNLIVNKCNNNRENLMNELKKIENYNFNGKKINSEVIEKLTNSVENVNVSELVDNCLAKNEKKTIYILNENNFSSDDCIIIVRTFLNKSKKIYALSKEYEINKNIEQTISSAKPPIFWKDKEITKQQINKWTPDNIRYLIYKLNELELLVKKNINNSINLVTDFILNEAST